MTTILSCRHDLWRHYLVRASQYRSTLPRRPQQKTSDLLCIRHLSARSSPDVVDNRKDDKDHRTTIRLYRIMQRQCLQLSSNKKSKIYASDETTTSIANLEENVEDAVLIQPQLRANDWGRSFKFMIPPTTTVEDLYQLFYSIFSDDEEEETGSTIRDWYDHVLQHSEGAEVSHDPLEPEGIPIIPTCWTSVSQLRQAIRRAFKTPASSGAIDPIHLHKWAIRAIQLLQQQTQLWSNSSVTTTDNIRVVATSRCIGTTTPTSALPPAPMPAMLETKHRFAYRIRVENLTPVGVEGAKEQKEDKTVEKITHIQLLGRHWNVQELEEEEVAIAEAFRDERAAHEGFDDAADEEQQDAPSIFARQPLIVDAPYTGAVGHLPVLKPGECFEYMSGTDLATTHGQMAGKFYMARVAPGTPSAKTGDHVLALKMDQDKFQVRVAPFPLVVEK